MSRRILTTGLVLVLGGIIAFTAFAQQDPAATQEQPEAQEEQQEQQEQAEQMDRTPFHAILAEKLGVDVETLEQAMQEAREEFAAQLPERVQERLEQRRARQGEGPEGQFNRRPGQFQGRFQGQSQGQGGPGGFGQQFGAPGMVKTTITHEFYHYGGNLNQFQRNVGPGGLNNQRPGR